MIFFGRNKTNPGSLGRTAARQSQIEFFLTCSPQYPCCREGEAAALDLVVQHFAGMLFMQRLRTAADREHAATALAEAWPPEQRAPPAQHPALLVTPTSLQAGRAVLARVSAGGPASTESGDVLGLLPSQLPVLECAVGAYVPLHPRPSLAAPWNRAWLEQRRNLPYSSTPSTPAPSQPPVPLSLQSAPRAAGCACWWGRPPRARQPWCARWRRCVGGSLWSCR